MEAPNTRAYRFGEFRLDLKQQRLLAPDGQSLALSGRAYDVLVHLVENRERVVTKDDLLKAVWPRVVVEENNLNQAISVLRRTLGDSRESPKFILTVAGRGFRFIADVTDEPSLIHRVLPASQKSWRSRRLHRRRRERHRTRSHGVP